MMTRRDGVQQKMLCVTLESLMPQEHFLRRMDSLMDFSFIYQRVESLYSHRGRPSIDPVVVVKMLLLGYLYGIDSERRLEQEVRVNIAYRWFLGIDLDEPVPDHSTSRAPLVIIKRSLYTTFLFYMFARQRSINSRRKHRAAMLTR